MGRFFGLGWKRRIGLKVVKSISEMVITKVEERKRC